MSLLGSGADVTAWVQLERDHAARYARRSGPEFAVRRSPGSGRVLVTAVHATETVRDGVRKLADRGTGGLADLVACHHHHAATMVRWAVGEDLAGQHLRDVLASAVRAGSPVIDLHGMKDQRDLDVELGLGSRPDSGTERLASTIATHLRASGLSVAVDEVYRGRRAESVVTHVQDLGGVALQVEIAARCRPPAGDHQRMKALVIAMERLCRVEAALSGSRIGREWAEET